MKTILFFLTMLILTTASMAANVRLAWNPMPAGEAWTEVRAYEVTGTTYTLLGTVPAGTNAITITGLSTGSHTIVVRSFNGQSESPDSNQVQAVILKVPASPTGVTIAITVQ